MADEAIQHMKQLKELAPDKPFFVYYIPGATHAPHHPTPEWIQKISDMHCSMMAGTKCARPSSPTKSVSASCLKTPS